jgi:hypothetical protein
MQPREGAKAAQQKRCLRCPPTTGTLGATAHGRIEQGHCCSGCPVQRRSACITGADALTRYKIVLPHAQLCLLQNTHLHRPVAVLICASSLAWPLPRISVTHCAPLVAPSCAVKSQGGRSRSRQAFPRCVPQGHPGPRRPDHPSATTLVPEDRCWGPLQAWPRRGSPWSGHSGGRAQARAQGDLQTTNTSPPPPLRWAGRTIKTGNRQRGLESARLRRASPMSGHHVSERRWRQGHSISLAEGAKAASVVRRRSAARERHEDTVTGLQLRAAAAAAKPRAPRRGTAGANAPCSAAGAAPPPPNPTPPPPLPPALPTKRRSRVGLWQRRELPLRQQPGHAHQEVC